MEFDVSSSLIPFFRSSSGTLPRLGNSRLITEPFRRQFEISDHLKWNKTTMAGCDPLSLRFLCFKPILYVVSQRLFDSLNNMYSYAINVFREHSTTNT